MAEGWLQPCGKRTRGHNGELALPAASLPPARCLLLLSCSSTTPPSTPRTQLHIESSTPSNTVEPATSTATTVDSLAGLGPSADRLVSISQNKSLIVIRAGLLVAVMRMSSSACCGHPGGVVMGLSGEIGGGAVAQMYERLGRIVLASSLPKWLPPHEYWTRGHRASYWRQGTS
jgi:hypothetical protein